MDSLTDKPILSVNGVGKVFGRKRWFNPKLRTFVDPRTEIIDLMNLEEAEQTLLEKPRKVNLALRNVSFDVHKGEVFVIMGLSGCGKSTMLRCINRLIEPTVGSIEFEGKETTTMKKSALRELRQTKISMVFQHFALLPYRTVLDNVAFGLEIQGKPREWRLNKAQEMLDVVGLGDRAGAFPDELSGGMKQRVGLARALVNEPDLLLMDEPFSALDPLIRTSLQDEVLELKESLGLTIIMVTHDLDEALTMGDRVAILSTPDAPGGNIMQIGTPAEIVLKPSNDYVLEFVKDVNRLKVLRVSDIMRSSAENETMSSTNAAPLKANQHLNKILHYYLLDGQRHPVEDRDGNLIGWVYAEDLNQALISSAEKVPMEKKTPPSKDLEPQSMGGLHEEE